MARYADDPTRDTSNVSADEIKGLVTTDPAEISDWIRASVDDERISVIFGTYQSAGRVAEALASAKAELRVLVCDEAHRTASLRRRSNADKGEDARLREFTLCHDQTALPARYRVYQTATPRIYNHSASSSPTLSAVAFLEPRRSPIDVVQAVGRAMRTAPGKELGYVICPVLIPPNADPEQWLATAHPEEGWSELGQILLALRAHHERIENELAELLQIYVPREHSSPPQTVTLVAAPRPSGSRIEYGVYRGTTESIYEILESAVADSTPLSRHGVEPVRPDDWTPATEPTRIVTAAMTQGGEVTLRVDSVARDRPRTGEARGTVNVDKSKKRARRMINNGEGRPVPAKQERAERERKAAEQRHEEHAQQMLDLVGSSIGPDVTVNLLARSGLRRDRVARDLNILESSVTEAAYHLRTDELQPALDAHFGLDHLAADKRKAQADGCTIAALLLMNAAMLHQRIAAGRWLRGVESLTDIKNSTDPRRGFERNWERIRDQDFLPVIKPAREVIYAVEQTGRLAGLERALRHLAADAERIAATYADMGADVGKPLETWSCRSIGTANARCAGCGMRRSATRSAGTKRRWRRCESCCTPNPTCEVSATGSTATDHPAPVAASMLTHDRFPAVRITAGSDAGAKVRWSPVLGFGREVADPVEALVGTEGRCRWVAGLPASWFRCASPGAG